MAPHQPHGDMDVDEDEPSSQARPDDGGFHGGERRRRHPSRGVNLTATRKGNRMPGRGAIQEDCTEGCRRRGEVRETTARRASTT